MSEILDFKNKEEFRKWLADNHDCGHGVDLFIYKKAYHHLGINYEDAVRTALCYGWIDSVVHSHDETKFRQYYSRRKKNSNWSISNITRMKELLENGEVSEYGLAVFDTELLDKLEDMIAEDKARKESEIVLPGYIADIFTEKGVLESYFLLSKSTQMMYLDYIEAAKQMKTKIRRTVKIAEKIAETKETDRN